MARVNIAERTEDRLEGPTITLVGWFDPDKARWFTEEADWDGSNNVSVATGVYSEHQMLYRTKGGRWVLHCWSQWQGTMPSYEFVSDERAREWLLLCGHDTAVAEHFGAAEEERGPGRPEVGNVVNVRLGDLKEAVDTYAAERDVSRAEAVRRLVAAGLR
ncbi:MAG: hypothetical protein ACRDRX_04370 [Pseudonocardiaceae bacterium]